MFSLPALAFLTFVAVTMTATLSFALSPPEEVGSRLEWIQSRAKEQRMNFVRVSDRVLLPGRSAFLTRLENLSPPSRPCSGVIRHAPSRPTPATCPILSRSTGGKPRVAQTIRTGAAWYFLCARVREPFVHVCVLVWIRMHDCLCKNRMSHLVKLLSLLDIIDVARVVEREVVPHQFLLPPARKSDDDTHGSSPPPLLTATRSTKIGNPERQIE